MNRTDAAHLLGVTEATLTRWVRQGLLRPASGGGEHFDREELEHWARQRGLSLGAARREEPNQPDDLLASSVQRGAVVRGVSPATASETIEIAVGELPGSRCGRPAPPARRCAGPRVHGKYWSR